jgi:L,D-transpeptidase ErfK/SrfK
VATGTAILTLAWLVVAAASPARVEVLGTVRSHVVGPDDTLVELARGYDLGFGEIAAANPGVDAFVPQEGSTVVIPTSFVLPRAAAPGVLTVNLSELRLYYWRPGARGEGAIATFPVGIASEDFETPLGTWHVTEKTIDPAWYVPSSARLERPELPAVVPPGPENPLGTHALKLSAPGVLIHGTHRPFGVGRKVSRGCIRLYPEDIPRLYAMVPVGTRVEIVREPVKVGTRNGRVFLEVHEDDEPAARVDERAAGVDEPAARVDERADGVDEPARGLNAPGGPAENTPRDPAAEALDLLRRRGLLELVDVAKVGAAAAEKRGLPVDVTR